MKQDELAARMRRTSSWMSQVERGRIPVRRLDLLQQLADELGVSVQTLNPAVPTTARTEPPAPARDAGAVNDLDGARLLISGHPALDVLLPGSQTTAAPSPSVEELVTRVEHVWELAHASQFADMSAALQSLVPDLERALRVVPSDQRRAVSRLLARTYQALSAAFVRQDEADAAWIAADRAIRAAEESGDPLAVGAGVFRLAQAFVRLQRLDQAEYAARNAVQVIELHVADRPAAPEELSVIGSLHLALALVYARGSRRPEARAEIEAARLAARALGADRNDYNLEFGPTNCEIQAVSTAVELGDAGEALDVGLDLDPTELSPERQARLYLDLGRAHVQRRHPGEALDCLLRAEELAPETVRSHVAARAAIRELVLIAGRSAPPELLDLAERADATE
ncbi:helix-turn-helix transcriptional regulator [Streptomyces sp. A7024]|uniref:Helix-turn-helix transcriptional regulator n=2 Tax=Streptomyces coryli TaxID=1128680 RepID=A0A6G4TUM1_9ACTN|nr:helix-turn-helix transcriptional regulator [Streptomyces coryli]